MSPQCGLAMSLHHAHAPPRSCEVFENKHIANRHRFCDHTTGRGRLLNVKPFHEGFIEGGTVVALAKLELGGSRLLEKQRATSKKRRDKKLAAKRAGLACFRLAQSALQRCRGAHGVQGRESTLTIAAEGCTLQATSTSPCSTATVLAWPQTCPLVVGEGPEGPPIAAPRCRQDKTEAAPAEEMEGSAVCIVESSSIVS